MKQDSKQLIFWRQRRREETDKIRGIVRPKLKSPARKPRPTGETHATPRQLPANCLGAVYFTNQGDRVLLKSDVAAATMIQAAWRGFYSRKYGFNIRQRVVFFRGGVVGSIGPNAVPDVGASPECPDWKQTPGTHQSPKKSPSPTRRSPSPSKTMRNMLQTLEDEDRWLERIYSSVARKHGMRQPWPLQAW